MSPARTVASLIAAGLAALALVTVAVVLILRQYSRDEAIRDARVVTLAEARTAIAPLLTDGLLGGESAALDRLDHVVRTAVLDGRVVRVKLWDGSGRIVYSDEPRLIGRRFPLEADELAVLRQGQVHADLSNLENEENVYERSFGKLLEVYVGLRSDGGRPALFEVYLRYRPVAATQRRLLGALVPALIGALVVLSLLQVPLGWSLSQRLQRGQRDRERLLRRTFAAGEHERHRVAADLHDSAVQHLAGSAYAVDGVADRIEPGGHADDARLLRNTAARLRQTVREMRTLIVAIAPPRLHEEGLAAWAICCRPSPLAVSTSGSTRTSCPPSRTMSSSSCSGWPRRPFGTSLRTPGRRM